MLDPDDAALADLVRGTSVSVADEDRALGSVVVRARTRVRRRRLTITGVSLVVVALVGSVLVINHRSDAHVHIQATHHLSAADVTFAIFARPATPADADTSFPDHGGFFHVDPKIGTRLAIRSDREKIHLYGALRTCRTPQQCSDETTPGGEYYCVKIILNSASVTTCQQAADFAEFGGAVGTWSGPGDSPVVFGMVPDFVNRVTYDGRVVPIVNNAFVVDGVSDVSRVVFSTPAGDKTPASTTPTTATALSSVPRTTTTNPAVAGSEVPNAALRSVLAPARAAPVRDECTLPTSRLADGNVSPLLCPGGGVNTLAWAHYAHGHVGNLPSSSSAVLQLAAPANATSVYRAMCSDYRKVFGTNPLTMSAEKLAGAYYGWHFADGRITTFLHQGCPIS